MFLVKKHDRENKTCKIHYVHMDDFQRKEQKLQCLPLYRFDRNDNLIDNITDWGLEQFVKQYNDATITKQNIFHYVYAVLHNPAYRKKYELNLKREFPRIPFYDDFRQWASWGEQLMNLHINYETVEPYQLQIADCALS